MVQTLQRQGERVPGPARRRDPGEARPNGAADHASVTGEPVDETGETGSDKTAEKPIGLLGREEGRGLRPPSAARVGRGPRAGPWILPSPPSGSSGGPVRSSRGPSVRKTPTGSRSEDMCGGSTLRPTSKCPFLSGGFQHIPGDLRPTRGGESQWNPFRGVELSRTKD